MGEEWEIAKIKEVRKKGVRGSTFVYVAEGDELVHIREYAIKELPGRYEDEIIYNVPKNKVIGKRIYCFNFSRSGNALLCKCNIEEFEDGRPKKYEYCESLEKRVYEIRNLKFRVRDPVLISLLMQFEDVVIPMTKEIKEYERTKNFEVSFMGHERRVEEAFKTPDVYYYTFMVLPKDRSRIRSLKVVRRWIYQLWVLKLLCNSLKTSKFKGHEHEGKAYWWVEQGSDYSTGVAETPFGDVTFWLEFQPSRGAHMIGMITEKRIPIRPDIVAVKGFFNRTKDFIDSKKPIDLLIECKEDSFESWKHEIDTQIIPYKDVFKPRNFIIASLEYVPDTVKKSLELRGVSVIDNLKPKSENIKVMSDVIRKAFE